MTHQRAALAFCWLILFSKVGICVHAFAGDAGLWLYILACFGYAYEWHVSLPLRLRRLWMGQQRRPGIERA